MRLLGAHVLPCCIEAHQLILETGLVGALVGISRRLHRGVSTRRVNWLWLLDLLAANSRLALVLRAFQVLVLEGLEVELDPARAETPVDRGCLFSAELVGGVVEQ